MTESGLEDYKGYHITVNNWGTFFAKQDGEVEAESKTLDGLHEEIDKISKKKIRKEVFVGTYSNRFAAGTLTSIKETRSGYYGEKFVLKVTVDGTSRQYGQDELYAKTPENMKLFAEYEALMAESQRIQDEAAQLMKKMTKINVKQILASRQENGEGDK